MPVPTSGSVRIVEVGPRDGLQNIKTRIPTDTKLELISRLQATGLKTIELTSTVSPKAVPQLADCQEVLSNTKVRSLLRDETLRLPVLVPNLKGLQVAASHGVKEIAVFVSASEGFSRANINATVAEGLSRARSVAQKARSQGCTVRGYVSCIFADPFDGPTPLDSVAQTVQSLRDMGCYEISLGDTLGVGTASNVKALLEHLQRRGIPISCLAGHFHDTYGQAVSNVWQAYQIGVRTFDSSVSGLGGCPFAPGAKGNVATEDLVYLFDHAGIQTGVDLMKLAKVGHWISTQIRKENSSRAGMALVVKHNLSPKGASKPTSTPLQWKAVEGGGDIKLFRSGATLRVLLNRPRNGNALTTAMVSQLTRLFEQVSTDRSVFRIVIQGQGKFFCTGMDLGKDSSVARSEEASNAQYVQLRRLFEVIDSAPQVTVACINGHAYGGGVGLAFVCDVRIALRSATVTLSEVKLGLCPATISKYVLREWGLAFTREAMLSARPISMTELKSLGLVSCLVDTNEQLLDGLDRYVHQLRAAAPEASNMCKELVKTAWSDPGGQQQESTIKELFEKMMRPDAEAAIGLKVFQSGQKTVDWETVLAKSRQAKL